MKDKDKGREFFRVNVRLPIDFRKLTYEEYKNMENIVKYSSLTKIEDDFGIEHLKGFIDKEYKENDRLFLYLEMINRKLDMVIGLLKNTDDDGMYTKRFFEVNLSGSGMKFLSDVEFCDGDFVEMRIGLPGLPFRKVTTLCEVVRSEKKKTNISSIMWEVALKFTVINENDRDLLVSFIFVKEREFLRNRKVSDG